MNLKVLQLLAGVVVVLGLLWGYAQYSRVPRSTTPFDKVVERAERITLQQGDSRLWLQKSGDWQVASKEDGPWWRADGERVKTLQAALQNLLLEDVLAESPDAAHDFEVDEASGTRVSLFDGKKQKLAEGIFGKQAPDFSHLYFRYPDQNKIWLARGLFRGELGGTSFNEWRDRQLVTLPEGQIETFRIEFKGTVAEVTKSSDTWKIGARPADANKVNTWLGAFAHLKADDFVSSETPSVADLKIGALIAKSSSTVVTLKVGALDKTGKRYPVSIDAAQGGAWIAENRLAPLLLKPADFLPAPPQ